MSVYVHSITMWTKKEYDLTQMLLIKLNLSLFTNKITLKRITVQSFFFFFFCFLGPCPRHMKVPRQMAEWELQLLAYATAMATQDLSRVCEPHHSSRKCQTAHHWASPRIKLAYSWIPVGFTSVEPQWPLLFKSILHVIKY